jgi:hypothetical protein
MTDVSEGHCTSQLFEATLSGGRLVWFGCFGGLRVLELGGVEHGELGDQGSALAIGRRGLRDGDVAHGLSRPVEGELLVVFEWGRCWRDFLLYTRGPKEGHVSNEADTPACRAITRLADLN